MNLIADFRHWMAEREIKSMPPVDVLLERTRAEIERENKTNLSDPSRILNQGQITRAKNEERDELLDGHTSRGRE